MDSTIKNENRLTIMEQKLDNISEDVKEIAAKLDKHISREEDKYEKLDAKYSGKWVEKFIIGIASGLVVAISGGIIMYLINN